MKQSAVEWLVEQLCIEGRKTLINQAKSIEKQRIFDAQVDILSEQIVKEKERSYSDEEVENILIEYVKTNPTKPYRVISWFQQFKNQLQG
jgi:hypothetical protein